MENTRFAVNGKISDAAYIILPKLRDFMPRQTASWPSMMRFFIPHHPRLLRALRPLQLGHLHGNPITRTDYVLQTRTIYLIATLTICVVDEIYSILLESKITTHQAVLARLVYFKNISIYLSEPICRLQRFFKFVCELIFLSFPSQMGDTHIFRKPYGCGYFAFVLYEGPPQKLIFCYPIQIWCVGSNTQ